ncbi:MAG: response regulator transcription factor [Candidatus Acidiferrales bacterium]
MRKILIVDDNESVRNALRDVLSRQNGWAVCGEATNGRSAVSLAVELKPDLIVLDFLMPLMNGLAAAAEISRTLPDVPIVLYTMHNSEQLDREAKRIGIKKVISKVGPFDSFVSELDALLHADETAIGPLGLSDNYAEKDAHSELPPASDIQNGRKTRKDGSAT